LELQIEERGLGAAIVETAFFGKTYGEAMTLLVEARNYLAYLEPVDRASLEPIDRLRLCCETMRLTARLTQIMAWLLAQRAVHAGEITRDEALADPHTLADLEVCMGDSEVDAAVLPPRLMRLLDRSQHLYVRVARLDEFARRRAL
jgi:regulator of CtrA degradation